MKNYSKRILKKFKLADSVVSFFRKLIAIYDVDRWCGRAKTQTAYC